MTRDEIIKMAREAGFVDESFCRWGAYSDDLERFFHAAYAAGAAAELEACAKVCDELAAIRTQRHCDSEALGAEDCAAAIRERSEK